MRQTLYRKYLKWWLLAVLCASGLCYLGCTKSKPNFRSIGEVRESRALFIIAGIQSLDTKTRGHWRESVPKNQRIPVEMLARKYPEMSDDFRASDSLGVPYLFELQNQTIIVYGGDPAVELRRAQLIWDEVEQEKQDTHQ